MAEKKSAKRANSAAHDRSCEFTDSCHRMSQPPLLIAAYGPIVYISVSPRIQGKGEHLVVGATAFTTTEMQNFQDAKASPLNAKHTLLKIGLSSASEG